MHGEVLLDQLTWFSLTCTPSQSDSCCAFFASVTPPPLVRKQIGNFCVFPATAAAFSKVQELLCLAGIQKYGSIFKNKDSLQAKATLICIKALQCRTSAA